MRGARDEIGPKDSGVSFLMFDIQRRIDLAMLPEGETVLCSQFQDLRSRQFRTWWLVCNEREADLCYVDPGKDVDCYASGSLQSMIDIWVGDLRLSAALKDRFLQVIGDRQLCRTFPGGLRSQRWRTRPEQERS